MNPMQNPRRLRGGPGRLVAALALLAIALPTVAADAEERPLSEEQRARLEARIDEIRGRLELTDEQRAQLEPVLRKDFERRIEILRKHGVTRESEQRPGRRETRALMGELKAIREATEAEVKRILDDRQMDEYRRIQEEARDEMREQIRSRRAGDST